ncbi:amino acid ABC transporter ATP-binding protein [Mesorhizobium sp. WSM3860]|uniref:amino acid ABC transporter ATP-binding protein n=1 Tax=Mesorhizobium sp. WSM3860 TaxID=2029403 RepID=UPI000BB0940E|nr:amino acid ABC transporter ATP-binding protein [Mesorhizobium sp. WSM3860]PBC03694.1 glutamine ABC transporter ATP-binding protein [Mesorhizobium sp. WSM3860]
MIEVDNLTKRFGILEVLKGISLAVEKGRVVSLIGASGSGKSTLLQCINGLEPVQAGSIRVDGTQVNDPRTDLNKLRQKIGIVFQQYNAFPHLTALENVALAPRIVKGLPKKEAAALAVQELAHFGLDSKANAYPSQLSGGQQQRLALARALAMQPRYLLLDEITSALDPSLVQEVLDSLRMLRKDGMTMLIVTHEIRFAREISDQVAFFASGKICEFGPPEQVIGKPQNDLTKLFLAAVK